MEKLTKIKFQELIDQKFGKNIYTVLGEYKGTDVKIEILHNICKNSYFPTPNNILHDKSSCPHCKKLFKKTTESFKKEIFDIVGNEYSVLGEYINTNTKIKMKHNLCGYEYDVSPHNFLGSKSRPGRRCPNCSKHIKLSIEKIQDLLDEHYGKNEYILLTKTYINNNTKMSFQHSCGNIFEATYLTMSDWNFNHCPKCNITGASTLEDFINDVKNLVGDEYSVIGTSYKNCDTPILMQHNICGHKYLVRPHSFTGIEQNRCPLCNINTSKGEEIIDKILTENSLNFSRQEVINGCKDKRELLFDFKIGNLYLEYDGEQHFKPYHNRDNRISKYIELFNHDRIKDEFCENNKIPLLRIPYTEFKNLETHLNKIVDFVSSHTSFSYQEFLEFKNSLNILQPSKTPIESLNIQEENKS